jgi:hypothetical protein
MNSCVRVDVNNDRRPDVVCTGATGITQWYENKGQTAASTTGFK